jgi:hypothetical protein
MRWFLGVLAAIAIAGVSVVSTLLATWRPLEPKAPLTAGLHGAWADISREFDGRVKRGFPLGMSEEKMGLELQHQGFARRDWSSTDNGQEHIARRSENNLVCNQAAYVYWRSDAQGRLTSVRGVYREEGCL